MPIPLAMTDLLPLIVLVVFFACVVLALVISGELTDPPDESCEGG